MKDVLPVALKLLRLAYLLFFLLVIFGLSAYLLERNPSLLIFETEESKVTWRPKSIETDLPEGKRGELIKYGYQLITNTPKLIGPLATDTKMQFAGNKLSCNNCHLNGGRKIGSGSFVSVTHRFPQFRGRENKIGTMEERINGCMERSMNGKPLPKDSKEMKAIIEYMTWLSNDVPEDMRKLYKGYPKINIPNERADTIQGRILYNEKCKVCHKKNGKGTPNLEGDGYLYPPLGGNYSFNDGAGMNRVITAAQFIKGNMPLGATYDNPLVTDEQAYHIAAYINTFDRPSKANKEADFPDEKLKPVSTPYGPWADNFPPEQHKFGPFQPIIKYYKEKYDLNKTK
ncbi:MAG: c-type cytochrome [Bacteroidota bacterium]